MVKDFLDAVYTQFFVCLGTPGTPKKFKRKLSRQISFQAAGNIAKWKARGQIKQKPDTSQPIDLKIDAKLESVNFYLMTSQVDLGMRLMKKRRQSKKNSQIIKNPQFLPK